MDSGFFVQSIDKPWVKQGGEWQVPLDTMLAYLQVKVQGLTLKVLNF